jgi:hypothetical protein
MDIFHHFYLPWQAILLNVFSLKINVNSTRGAADSTGEEEAVPNRAEVQNPFSITVVLKNTG